MNIAYKECIMIHALCNIFLDPNEPPTEPPTEEKATTVLPHDLPSSSTYTRVNAVLTALISYLFSTSAAIVCSSVTATSAVFFTTVATSSESVMDIQSSQFPYTTRFVTPHPATSTMPSALIVGNASMPHSYLLLYVGELMKLCTRSKPKKYLAFKQMVILLLYCSQPTPTLPLMTTPCTRYH